MRCMTRMNDGVALRRAERMSTDARTRRTNRMTARRRTKPRPVHTSARTVAIRRNDEQAFDHAAHLIVNAFTQQ